MKRYGLFLVIALFSCVNADRLDDATCIYDNPIDNSVAAIVVEENGQVKYVASAFLINSNSGTFLTADHVVADMRALYINEAKIFFHGQEYTARVIKALWLYDVAVVQIASVFDPDGWPSLYVSDDSISIGDTLFVQGIHPHPNSIIKQNQRDDYPDKVVPILRNCYFNALSSMHYLDTTTKEFVFDNLIGEVTDFRSDVRIGDKGSGTISQETTQARQEINSYAVMRPLRQHHDFRYVGFTYAGLSGGPVLDKAGGVVGVVTAESELDIIITPIIKMVDQLLPYLPR